MKTYRLSQVLLFTSLGKLAQSKSCPDYLTYSKERHPPYSSGKFSLPYQRPAPECRTFNSTQVEDTITKFSSVISDPDLYRLFQNSFPNTLDTAIRWHGVAANDSREELTFIITGDINAMWLRDSANQLQSYFSLLKPDSSTNSLASLYRGVINLQARYLLTSPFCNSFQPPVESGIPPEKNDADKSDTVFPPYNPDSVFECKYELDSLAAFLQISSSYYTATKDKHFFAAFQWVPAIRAVLDTAMAMMTPTYGPKGQVLDSPYTFTRTTTRNTETLANDGLGSPVAQDTGLIRSAFRPSDDGTMLPLLVPANMMFARYLEPVAAIMAAIGQQDLVSDIRSMASSLRAAISRHGVITVPKTTAGSPSPNETTGEIYAYEVDGFGSSVIMDDANIPSLLSAPLLGYVDADDEVYRRTRARILDADGKGNPYFMRGPVINAVGGPHAGPGMAWPMASIVRILTSGDDGEIVESLREVLASTDGLGLIHESVDSWNASRWTRPWFSWANGLFGQMILDLEARKLHILKQSFQ